MSLHKLETSSKASSPKTCFSLRSITSSAAVQARAKAEALKAKMEFALQEAELRKQEQEIANAMLLLSAKRDLTMAQVEADLLEAACDDQAALEDRNVDGIPTEDPVSRVEDYVSNHQHIKLELPEVPDSIFHIEVPTPKPECNGADTTKTQPTYNAVSMPAQLCNHPEKENRTEVTSSLKEHLNCIGNMMVRKELVRSGLRKFNGKICEFRAWKASFKQATRDLDLRPFQEMDLILDSLEREPKTLITPIHAIHADKPEIGMTRMWKFLETKYGSSEAIEQDLLKRMQEYPKIAAKDNLKLEQFGYLLLEAQYAKEKECFPGLLVLDSASGLTPLMLKLPERLQDKWRLKGSDYKEKHNVSFPPFKVFVSFVQQHAKIQNDPSFSVSTFLQKNSSDAHCKPTVTARKTEVNENISTDSTTCPIHNTKHELKDCRRFKEIPYDQKNEVIKRHRLCFKCLKPSHLARNCKSKLQCQKCSRNHLTVMHKEIPSTRVNTPTSVSLQAENKVLQPKCTKVCGQYTEGRSCAKICLANVYHESNPNKRITTYVLIDDQSDGSLINRKLLESFKHQCKPCTYAIKTVGGCQEVAGRSLSGLIVESLDGEAKILAPTVRECDGIPGDVSEVPTPEVAEVFDHLRPIASLLPPLREDAEVSLLIGRDAPQFHKVREVINGGDNQPWAHRLDLGWVVIGEVCLNGAHIRNDRAHLYKDSVTTFFTQILTNGRNSLNFQSCRNAIEIRKLKESDELFGKNIFEQTNEDENIGSSSEDLEFIELMDKQMVKDDAGNWIAPLPFKKDRQRLPNNKFQAEKRMKTLLTALDKNQKKKDHYFEFMGKILNNKHAIEVDEGDIDQTESWYLPHFGVYHPQKPDKLRVVFDSSAKFSGVSLNDTLLSGPDLMNQLLGVLIRFREQPIAVTGDIEQMFYAFKVREDHRKYLRFLWFKSNKPDEKIVTYCMTVHIFGNKPSPAVAISGLKKTGEKGEAEFGSDVKRLINDNFYMDDLLKSFPTVEDAVDVMKRTKDLLKTANIRLHKFTSNNSKVLASFKPEELAPVLATDLSLKFESTIQRTLGVSWNLKMDSFTFQLAEPNLNLCTKRMVLSEVNGIYDPMGLAAPVIIVGKMLLREMSKDSIDWDEPLPNGLLVKYKDWRRSLKALEEVRIPRPFTYFPSTKALKRELHIFGDASNIAIGAACYLRTLSGDDEVHVRLVMGKAKLAPKAATTIPRLELCASVLATEIEQYVKQELHVEIDKSRFYSDSKVVLGYLTNRKRRFRTYVCNRVTKILKTSKPEQWTYVPSAKNPADLASKSIPAADLGTSMWISGPDFLKVQQMNEDELIQTEIEVLDNDPEVHSEGVVNCNKAVFLQPTLGTNRFVRFSSWESIIRAVTNLLHIIHSFKSGSKCNGWHVCDEVKPADQVSKAEVVVLKSLQSEVFATEIAELKNGKISRNNRLISLNPYLDCKGILRVGGRLHNAHLSEKATNPIILPKNNHLTGLIIKRLHQKSNHQGRHITFGMVRNEGYWILGGQRQIAKVIQDCVICKRLRGKRQEQIMASLPEERLSVSPPFTFVGIDVFGPFQISSRRTRGSSHAKRWAVMFTCMSTRGVHIETLESMDSSSFINALRRLFAIRGPVKQIRSDCGTNFVGACNILGNELCDKDSVKRYLLGRGCEWIFNPPHASHMGGAWERMIGIARRILDGIMREVKPSQITHEVFTTLMAEIAAIINSRPLLPDSNIPELPLNLSPNMMLTMKSSPVTAPEGPFNHADLLRSQWRRVQHLSNMFWSKWRKQYLPLLQTRTKWQTVKRDISVNDIVLVKQDLHRNDWPLGRIVDIASGSDGHVRKASVEVIVGDCKKTILRPINELLLLIPTENQ